MNLNGLFESTYHSDPNVRMQAELALREVTFIFVRVANSLSVRETSQLLLGFARDHLRTDYPHPSETSCVHLL